jgi:hypothetical protein
MLRPAGQLVARCFAHEVHAAEDDPLAALGSPVAVVFRDLARTSSRLSGNGIAVHRL